MDTKKFTPGPWKIQEFDTGWIVGPNEIDSEDYIADVGDTTVHKHISEVNYERERANAHLIAAAPDLYAALEDALHIIHTASREAFCNGVTDPTGTMDEGDVRSGQIYAYGMTALTRARGEVP